MAESKVLFSLGTILVDGFQKLDDDNGSVLEASEHLGGGSFYALIGARQFLPAVSLRGVFFKGEDLPADLTQSLSTFGEDMFMIEAVKHTTKALTTYQNGRRSFEYLTPCPPFDFARLAAEIFQYQYLHTLLPVKDIEQLLLEIATKYGHRPRIVYEPYPFLCTPEYRQQLLDFLPCLYIFSPNLDELYSMWKASPNDLSVKSLINEVFDLAPSFHGHLVLRCGSQGSCVASRGRPLHWIPPYWTHEQQSEVREVTGAGNSFLGGLVAGLELEHEDIVKAVDYATVAASFLVQQPGVPSLKDDLWNGEDPKQRLNNFRARSRQ